MNFLLDVHISNSLSRALVAAGHDVARAASLYPTWTDEDLLALAIREDRIMVTQDGDFTDLIFAFGLQPPRAVIYIRCDPEHQLSMVDRVLDVVQNEDLLDQMVVITPANTRYRHFPKMDK